MRTTRHPDHFESISATRMPITACGLDTLRRRTTSNPMIVSCKRCRVHVANIAQSLDLFGRALAIDIESKETTTMSTKSNETKSEKLTYTAARKLVRAFGLTLTKRDGEYRVGFPGVYVFGGEDPRTYYTSDLDDALATARDMSARERTRSVCCVCKGVVELTSAGLCGDCGGVYHVAAGCNAQVERPRGVTPCMTCAKRRARDLARELHGTESLAFHELCDKIDAGAVVLHELIPQLLDDVETKHAHERDTSFLVLAEDGAAFLRARAANVEGDVAPPASEQPIAPWQVPAVSIGSSDVVEQLVNALGVIALTPHIAEYLSARDPKALVQVKRAIRAAGRGELLAKSDTLRPIESDSVEPEITCPICKGTFPTRYYDETHVPCPERGDERTVNPFFGGAR